MHSTTVAATSQSVNRSSPHAAVRTAAWCFDELVIVRSCSAEDLALLRERWADAGEVAASHYAEQETGQATLFVAWDGVEAIGWELVMWTGCLGENAKARFPNCAEVIHLQVRPEHRGRGAGTELIHAAEQAIHGRRLCVAGSVAADNLDALRLYLRLGYQRTGVIDVSEYSWTDADGAVHHVLETNELIIKPVPNTG